MRRALAAVLVLLFSIPLIAPAFASGPDESSLPACCRRDGKHHCAMMSMGAVPSQYAAVSEKCPYSFPPQAALMLPHLTAALYDLTFSAPEETPAFLVRQAESARRISRDRARQKRGPPRLLAL